jgi:tRNA(adenine34) deaminase
VNARVEKLVVGTKDLKTGACGSVLNIVQMEKLNHQIDVQFGVLEEECAAIIKDFFSELRKQKNK